MPPQQDQNLEQVDNDQQVETRTNIWWVIFLLGLLLLVTVAYVLFVYVKEPNEQRGDVALESGSEESEKDDGPDFSELNNAMRGGDVDLALQHLDELRLEGAESVEEQARLDFTEAMLKKRLSPEEELLSVKTFASIAGNQAISNERRAQAVDAILDVYYNDRNPDVLDAAVETGVFPVNGITTTADYGSAAQKIAEYGNSLYPLWNTVFRESIWYAGQLLDNNTLSDKVRAEYAAEIEQAIDAAKSAFATDPGGGYSVREEISFYHWQGFMLAVIALATDGNSAQFEDSFQTSINLADQARESSGGIIRDMTAYTHFYYAAFLVEMYGNERESEVVGHIGRLLNVVSESREKYDRVSFPGFAQVEGKKGGEEQDHNYRFFVNLAEVSPAFRAFLKEEGWTL